MDKLDFVETATHRVDAVAFRRALIAWGEQHFRPFPWRETSDPYAILMSEIMLHRTQAVQVIPVYERFIRRYPNVASLAQTCKEDLHALLSSLGLRWRIDLVKAMAADLIDHFGGKVPEDRRDLLSLPGVSEYIASAVRCFTWNLPEPILDTNSVRVIGRLFGLSIKDSSRRNRQFRELIAALLDLKEPRQYNYALLDLADRICTKKKLPQCTSCPLARWCVHGTAILSLSGESGGNMQTANSLLPNKFLSNP